MFLTKVAWQSHSPPPPNQIDNQDFQSGPLPGQTANHEGETPETRKIALRRAEGFDNPSKKRVGNSRSFSKREH